MIKPFITLQEFHFHFLGKIWIKLNHKKTIIYKINCFDCANDLIGLEQA